MEPLTREEIKAYLSRLGISEIQEPTKAFLFELHRAHVRVFSWQTIDVFAGKPAGIQLNQSVPLLIHGRSGYCFHLNGAFSQLLRSLGYKVSFHRAGVQPLGAEPRINSFHLGLTAHLLNENNEEEQWIIDVGLGDMPFEPLPLLVGTYNQNPFIYKVTESLVVPKGWRLEHDPSASFVGVDYDAAVLADMTEFEPKHEHYSRSAESPWINMFLIRNRHAGGSNEIRGCIWNERGTDGVRQTELVSQSQWLEVLGEVFEEKLVNYSRQERDELWKRIQLAHEQWKIAKASSS
ncbi:arylamine N-acetyltransferase [Paenibacillus sp. FSL K6-3182]|uniref:arylamine N-acetyltransferase family protein n=1 Tax=Paenibacillus sp. FSL K6-3182 TaxID=2921495 RepID=UPI0030D2A082